MTNTFQSFNWKIFAVLKGSSKRLFLRRVNRNRSKIRTKSDALKNLWPVGQNDRQSTSKRVEHLRHRNPGKDRSNIREELLWRDIADQNESNSTGMAIPLSRNE
jgi:hypothetical protein